MPFRFPPVRRPALTLSAIAAAAALALGGCSAAGEKPAAAPAQTTGGTAAFPVTIDSALGQAKITEQPERVVTLGQGSTETAIALGFTPVGIESYAWGSDKTGYLPWIHEAVTKAGGTLPKQFAGGEDIDFDTIVELEPDVILAPWSGITKEQYSVLSGIAPTVAYPDLPWSTNWDQQIEIISKALGKPAEAQTLISTIKKQLSDAAATRPQYKGVTFSYIYTTGPGTLGVFKPEEQRVEMVTSLGLTPDPVVNSFKETEGTDSALIGLENAQKLAGSDLIFTFYTDGKTRKEIEAQKLYAAIPAVKRGGVVASDDTPFVTASSIINPLTVPWVIDRYLPLIDKAVATTGK
ncbi:iron-siderophore ABC transporter substrate-binding protein [Streptosporangium roseum]|uniref:Ferric enterobactin ABC transporter, ferric enterobactin-binding periplasmic protein FepB n=1 Tax=Streptosporangium roseum (strain ATCC 12428 / DSM 43021 / JCM 3005 / KCTC 9067 / NCIMB 10171 / NRRL 2505 / NI 9100) TaxID=479432 RepID=D2BA08_STRRD|nr:iron-siderophore ABC transporter substrate-binding protein [Streptosporangium roseum]ACZ86021.1 ferric enterobactin ABC transporter, ferric enterobactin-binding periplasmic protein FepB [Streptosporangium roseum DSM 43021]